MSRSTSTSSAATSVNLSRSLSVKATSTSTSVQPSNVRLFLTNLRLLKLDLLADWPSITAQTFSAKNADQKARIKAVEWALFRLFEIWDPDETREKLRPFFPPLEPLQSLNLRAALYRCLNELKKNGVLGRESVLRKTMLDECKGDKFFEVLVLFSNAVLRKTISQRKGLKKPTAIARKLATAPTLSPENQSSLLPLAIAHKAALTALLRKKDEQRARYAAFARLLESTTQGINTGNEQCEASSGPRSNTRSQMEGESVKKELRDNWIGNTKWLDTMLHGDDAQADEAYLQESFHRIWSCVERGQSLQNESTRIGLLENLEKRVKEQRSRLQKWKAFHTQMKKEKPLKTKEDQEKRASTQPAANAYRWDAHLDLQFKNVKPPEEGAASTIPLDPLYAGIIAEMEANLAEIAKAKRNRAMPKDPFLRRGSSYFASRSPIRRRTLQSEHAPKTTPNDLMGEQAPKFAPPVQRRAAPETYSIVSPEIHAHTPLDSDATLVANTLGSMHPPFPSSEPPDPPESPIPDGKASEPSPPPIQEARAPPTPDPTPSADPTSPSLPTYSDDEAVQIISSIGAATPSPTKKAPRPSLMDRARMSMAHASSFRVDPPSPVQESPSSPPPAKPEPTTALDRRTSLLERTRQSMSRVAAQPRVKARREEGRKRLSVFPVNQFETPRKGGLEEEEGEGEERTPKEDLFEGEEDYERVFRSRPRVACSPVLGPREGGLMEEEEEEDSLVGLGLEGVDEEEEGTVRGVWESSPLRGFGRR